MGGSILNIECRTRDGRCGFRWGGLAAGREAFSFYTTVRKGFFVDEGWGMPKLVGLQRHVHVVLAEDGLSRWGGRGSVREGRRLFRRKVLVARVARSCDLALVRMRAAAGQFPHNQLYPKEKTHPVTGVGAFNNANKAYRKALPCGATSRTPSPMGLKPS